MNRRIFSSPSSDGSLRNDDEGDGKDDGANKSAPHEDQANHSDLEEMAPAEAKKNRESKAESKDDSSCGVDISNEALEVRGSTLIRILSADRSVCEHTSLQNISCLALNVTETILINRIGPIAEAVGGDVGRSGGRVGGNLIEAIVVIRID